MSMLKLSMVEDNDKNQLVFTKDLLNLKCVYTKYLGVSSREQNETTIFVINSWIGKKAGAGHHSKL